jgi:RNA polymerase sigma-70 factor, ECF subfamily
MPKNKKALLMARCDWLKDKLGFSFKFVLHKGRHALMDMGEKLVQLYPTLQRYAVSLTRSKETAEDLVMAVIVKLLEKKNTLDPDINLQAYAFRSIKNAFIDSRRHAVRQITASNMTTAEDDDGSDFLSSIVDEASAAMTFSSLEFRDLSRALCSLGDECLEILTLFGVGNTYSEISDLLEMKMGTVMSRMSRCRARLSQRLDGTV